MKSEGISDIENIVLEFPPPPKFTQTYKRPKRTRLHKTLPPPLLIKITKNSLWQSAL